MRKYFIVLEGTGGELDRVEVPVREDQDEAAVIGNALVRAVEDWTLSPGDTIKIVEA